MNLSDTPRLQAVALVAEDEPLLRMAAADLLNDIGFRVLEASDAAAALHHLEQHPEVQLLFTDVQMPGPIDGYALARVVAHRWSHVAIVVVSGGTIPRPGDLPAKARFLPKPYRAGLILEAVQELLMAPRSGAADPFPSGHGCL